MANHDQRYHPSSQNLYNGVAAWSEDMHSYPSSASHGGYSSSSRGHSASYQSSSQPPTSPTYGRHTTSGARYPGSYYTDGQSYPSGGYNGEGAYSPTEPTYSPVNSSYSRYPEETSSHAPYYPAQPSSSSSYGHSSSSYPPSSSSLPSASRYHSNPFPYMVASSSGLAASHSEPSYPTHQEPTTRRDSADYQPEWQPRPFACDLCSMSFNRQHDLKRHRDTHTGEKPFFCNGGCGKSFTRADALKRHQLVKGCGSID